MLTAITRVQNPGDRSTGYDPSLIRSCNRDTASAGCECRFILARTGHIVSRNFPPRRTAVRGCDDHETPVHWIAENDSVSGVPERKTIEKTLGIMICQLEGPCCPAVRCFENAGFFSITDAEDIS